MSSFFNLSRRTAIKSLVYGAVASTVTVSRSEAEAVALKEDDPTAKALHYVEDVHRSKDAKPGSACGSCALYAGAKGSKEGPCPAFANKIVKATGWCSAFAPKI